MEPSWRRCGLVEKLKALSEISRALGCDFPFGIKFFWRKTTFEQGLAVTEPADDNLLTAVIRSTIEVHLLKQLSGKE
jgi:hypothetical protein